MLIGTSTAPAAAANTITINQPKISTSTPTQVYFGSKPITVKPVTKPTPTPIPTPTPVQTPAPTPTPTPVSSSSNLPTSLTAMEQQMVDLVNQERVNQGLKPLEVDMRLVKAARLKSQDMIDKNYTGHISPTYGSPFDMLKSMGITYKTAGENIAGAGTVERAHTNLMNSAGHRANILYTQYTKIGIGIIQGGPYGLMITQIFMG
ncbi:CAP domain-containing protein [Pelosinus sp. sgz500959]|uniref:CAP domain-containing protein n=1 Tax=Pelosinus sp. sgz500959 TaxID=3242472 RepID=UPI00366B23FF